MEKELKKYFGSCHCGEILYEINANINYVIMCNCSFCSKKGWLIIHIDNESFKLIKGDKYLGDYQFAKKRVNHFTCINCGISVFSKGIIEDNKLIYAINTYCLDNIDLKKIEIKHFDDETQKIID